MTKIFAILRFFYCMNSLPNRRFLAYMPKKFSLEKSSSGTSIRLLYSKLSKYCIVLYCINKYCIWSATETVSSCREFDVIGVKSKGRGSKTCERFVNQLTTRERFGIRRRHARKLLFSSLNFLPIIAHVYRCWTLDDSDHVSVKEYPSTPYLLR